MTRVPAPAIIIGILGLLPFFYAAALLQIAPNTLPTLGLVPSSPTGGMQILERFGAVILGFMGGCLWGFASNPGRVPTLALLAAASVPAAIAFVAIQPNPALSCVWLAYGFVVLQVIDWGFQRIGAAPEYWLSLRLPLTAGVITCLLLGALHG